MALSLPQHLHRDLRDTRLCFLLPPLVASPIVSQGLATFMIRSPWSYSERCPQWVSKYCSALMREHFRATLPHSSGRAAPFSLEEVAHIMGDLRKVLADNSTASAILPYWIDAFDQLDADLAMHNRRSTGRLSPMQLVEFVLLAAKLHDSKDLLSVAQDAIRIVLPPVFAKHFEELLKCMPVPDKSTLSRARLFLESAFMLYHRVRNFPPREGYIRSLAWDSSPQFGRDYQLSSMRSIKKSSRRFLFLTMDQLYNFWNDRPWQLSAEATRERMKQEEEIMSGVAAHIDHHVLPAVNIGYGASGFAFKLASQAHSMRLEHFTHHSLEVMVHEITTNMNDWGTESSWNRLQPVALNTLCQNFTDTSADDIATVMNACKTDVVDAPQPAVHFHDEVFHSDDDGSS